MARLTLEQIEEIEKKKTWYHIIYENEDGVENIQIRDTVERAFFLYQSEKIELKPKGRLEEVRADGSRVVIRGYGTETYSEILIKYAQKEAREREERRKHSEMIAPKSMIQALLGDVSYDEYKTSVENFAKIHGTTPEKWGINL